MQVNNKVKLSLAHIFDDLEDPQHGKGFEPVSEPDPVDLDSRIGITGHFDDLPAWSAHNHRNPGVRKALANCAQGRQTHHHVAELAKIDDQNIVRIERHFKCLSKKSDPAWYPRSQS